MLHIFFITSDNIGASFTISAVMPCNLVNCGSKKTSPEFIKVE